MQKPFDKMLKVIQQQHLPCHAISWQRYVHVWGKGEVLRRVRRDLFTKNPPSSNHNYDTTTGNRNKKK